MTAKSPRCLTRAAAPSAVAGSVAVPVSCVAGLAYRATVTSAVVQGDQLSFSVADTIKGPGLQRTRGTLGDGLLNSEGAAHDRARRLAAPAFSPGRLAGYTSVFARYTRDCMTTWADGECRDMNAEIGALTLRIAGQTLLGTDLSAQAARVRADLEVALAEFSGDGRDVLSGVGRDTGGAARAALHGLVDDILEQRQQTTAHDRGDVICRPARSPPSARCCCTMTRAGIPIPRPSTPTAGSTIAGLAFPATRTCPSAPGRGRASASSSPGRRPSPS